MKKARVDRSRRVTHGHVEDRFPRARKPDRASDAGDFRKYRVKLPGNNLLDRRETDAVFVAEGKITQQIAGGQDSPRFENGSAMRSHTAQIFHRVVE